MNPAHGLSVGFCLQNYGHLPSHQLVQGDILEHGLAGDKMGIQMVMRLHCRFLVVDVCFANIPDLRRPDPISCCKWDVSYFMTLKKKITNFYVAYAQFIPTIHLQMNVGNNYGTF